MSDFQTVAVKLSHALKGRSTNFNHTHLSSPRARENTVASPTCMCSSVCFQVRALSVDLVASFIVTPVYPPLPLGIRGLHRQRPLPRLHYDRRVVPNKVRVNAEKHWVKLFSFLDSTKLKPKSIYNTGQEQTKNPNKYKIIIIIII